MSRELNYSLKENTVTTSYLAIGTVDSYVRIEFNTSPQDNHQLLQLIKTLDFEFIAREIMRNIWRDRHDYIFVGRERDSMAVSNKDRVFDYIDNEVVKIFGIDVDMHITACNRARHGDKPDEVLFIHTELEHFQY